MTKEELSQISMMIIAYAGIAKSLAFEAIKEFKNENIDLAKKNILEAEENLKLANKEHFKCLTNDSKSPVKIDILFVHAEDQLSSAEIILSLVKILF